MPTSGFNIREVEHSHPGVWQMDQYAWGNSPEPPPTEPESEDPRPESRMLMAFDNDRPIGKIGTYHLDINVRGTIMRHGGLGGAVSLPIGRRQGTMRSLVTESLARMRADGYAVATLYPFRESFYERMGFSLWPHPQWALIDPANLSAVLRVETSGEIDHVMLRDDFAAWDAFIHDIQRRHHGMAVGLPNRQKSLCSDNGWWLVSVREGGSMTGAMLYKLLDQSKTMLVWSFATTTLNARYQLLDWIARHVDQVKEARLRLFFDERPELWWTDARITVTSQTPNAWLAPMGRVVDVPRLAGIGSGEGSICIDISDPVCPWNAGVWTFTGRDGLLQVEPGGQPEARLEMPALSALVFTGADSHSFAFRGWGDVPPDTAQRLQSMFPTINPFLHEEF